MTKTTAKPQDTTTFDSMRSAASGAGIPLSVLRSAKRAGCPAFRNTRVFLLEFVAWYFSRKTKGDTEVIDLEYERGRETRGRADLIQIEKAKLQNLLYESDEVDALIAAAFVPNRQMWTALPTLAPRVNPSDPSFARAALEQYRDEALRYCREVIQANEKQEAK